MESTEEYGNQWENEINDRNDEKSPCNDGDRNNIQEASEVILRVPGGSKASKYIQALWYLKHINSTITVETSSAAAADEDENNVSVVSIATRDGGEISENVRVQLTSNTLISYIARSYRFVFVIDISPSTFIVDGTAGCVPHSRIVDRLAQCLEGFVTDGTFLPADKFFPELYITICFYSPFIAFDDDRVILQRVLLTKENAGSILDYVRERLAVFSNRLCWTMQPHLRRWNQERKRMQRGAEDLLPECFFRQQSHGTDGIKDSIYGLKTLQMTSRMGSADEGFINSEWSLMFMLRAGLIGLQLLPEKAQPNIVLITDAVCHVTDVHALQKLMIQLRNYSVACSFIQVQGDCSADAVFGHFSSPEFFVFLARATSGVYVPDRSRSSSTAEDVPNIINSKPFLCKTLQLQNTTNDYIRDLIHQINPEFVESYTIGVVRRMHYSMEYESTAFEYLLRLRLYEGFMLKNIKVSEKEKEESSLLVELSLPWKPQVTIDYKIFAPSKKYMERTKLKITVICEAPYGLIRDLLSDRHFINSAKQTLVEAYRHTIFSLLESDRMLIHVHSFNTLPDFYHLPSEVLREKSLFRYVMKGNKPILTLTVRELETICSENVTAANFVEFWRIVSEFEEGLWQKWYQVYTFRIILAHDHPLPPGLFLAEEPSARVTSQLALTTFHNMLVQITTFSLVHGQTYVKFVEGDGHDEIPKSFYIIKVSLETPFIVMKLAFPDGLTDAFRQKVIRICRENLNSLTVERSCFYTRMLEFADVGDDRATVAGTVQLPALAIINQPLEIMLARYKKIPLVLDRIIRLEKIDEANRELILHNSLAKYFSCRRFIWCLKKAFPLSSPISCLSADFILHTILQRRLSEGFHIAYGNNGIVNLVKHVDEPGHLHSGPKLLQYIIFPPTAIRAMRITKEQMEKMLPLSKTVGMRGVEAKKLILDENFTLKSDVDLQLMTELWSESSAVTGAGSVTLAESLQQQIRSVDEDIICTLSTLDQVMSLCTHHYSCSHFTLSDCRDSSEFRKCERLSTDVEILHNCFYIRLLLKNATERELLLLPTLSYQNDDPSSNIRLQILLESLHCELAKASNVTIEVRNPNFWLEITGGIDPSVLKRPAAEDDTNEKSFCPTRIYVSRLSPWRITIAVLLVNPRHIVQATSSIMPTIPLLIFHCDEPWIAHHLARAEPWHCETYIADHRTKSPTSTLAHLNRQIRKTEKFTKSKTNELELHWLSTARISATENVVHTSFDLHSYCEAIEDQLFSRALIGAVYRSLLEGVYLPYEDLVEVLEDRCEQSDIEVEGIDECIRFLCSHVANIRRQSTDSAATDADDETRSSDLFRDDVIFRLNDAEAKTCEEEQEEFRIAFDALLSQNFRKIPSFPSYFYFVRNSGTHLANQNLTINPREAKDFTKTNSPCEDLEIYYVRNEEDKKEENDSAGSSKSSISFESISASGSSDDEILQLSDTTVVPLFLNFSCAVRFSNMEMYTFPIDHLPSCVTELLKQCSDISKKNLTAMDLIGISFDIYVLSWPALRIALDQSDSCTISPKNQDFSPNSPLKSTTFFDFDSPYAGTSSDIIAQLPRPESEAVSKLEFGITRLLRMETMLVLSRYDDVTLDTLHKVMNFVTDEQKENSDPSRVRLKVLQIVMVMEQLKAVRRLRERIKNFHLLYCKMEAHPESNSLFYCCRVSDPDLYEVTLTKQARAAARLTSKSARRSTSSFTERVDDRKSRATRTRVPSLELLDKPTRRRDSSVPAFCARVITTSSEDSAELFGITDKTHSSDHELRDFWIVVNVEVHQIQVYFCERYAHHHDKIFELFLEAVQKECHIINQELLLEKMHATNECDNLLIESETLPHATSHDTIPDTKLTRSLVHKRSGTRTKKKVSFTYSEEDEVEVIPYTSARVVYPPGHFACRIVAHHWFYIHPRLHTELRGKGFSLMMGYDALRQGIEQFAVRNRHNLYVYCEENKRNIFYIQLFASEESFKERCPRCDITTIAAEIDEKFQNNVLLTVHGVHEPATVIQSIVDTMQKRLDLKVLEELTSTLHKNPLTRLTATDVEFIQRDPAKPFAVHYCTLPNYTFEYLGSLYYYMSQQMLTFTTEARFRDYSESGGQNNALYERPYFHSHSVSHPHCNNYVPHFFLINKPPTKGSSNLGIACVETHIVNSNGDCVDSLNYAQISASTHSKLYPGGGKLRLSSSERFHELTRCITTSLPLPDSLLPEKIGGVLYLVQYTIWQVGDIGLASLQPRFRLALQQALCDLVTEFGLLGVPVLDVAVPRISTSSNQIIALHATEQRKRSSSDAPRPNAAARPFAQHEPQMQHLQSPKHLLQQSSHKSRSPIKAFAKYTLVRADRQSLTPIRGTDDYSSNDDGNFCALVNSQFVAVAAQWFDHVVSEVKNTEHQFSVKRHTFHCESDHSVQKIFSVIRDKLCGILNDETVAVCQLETRGVKRFSTQISDDIGLTFSNDNGRILAVENEETSLILLAYNQQYSEEVLKYGADSRSNIIPAAIEEVLRDPKAHSVRFLPQVAPFVPRQHLLYLLSKGEMATLYLYNYSPDAAAEVYKMVANVLCWQNARSRLLREIGLHKMGITHLAGQISPAGEELVWLNGELLSEYEIPQYGSEYFDKRLIVSGAQYFQAEPLMHLYRHTPIAFLPLNLNSNNLFEDQCLQMVMLVKEMKWMLYDCEQFERIHSELLKGTKTIKESELLKIVSHCREVHFVRSPLLLFPKWRRLVAAVRRVSDSYRKSMGTDSPRRRVSGSKVAQFDTNTSLLGLHIRSTRSNTFSTSTCPLNRPLRKLTKTSEEGEPCCLKIQFMFAENYVEYLKKQGLQLLEVITVADRHTVSRYSLHYDTLNTELSPSIWMYKACNSGIIFVHIAIAEPYFSVRYLLWNVTQLNRPKVKYDEKFECNDQRELEQLKDSIVSNSHVHSFTYDFHLYIVATYLIGGQQVLFYHGYNTNEFLIDFLQYYSCRPPYACNCIYEEKLELPTVPVSSQKVWEYLLDEKRDDCWRVVRLKPVEVDMPGQFMIVSEDDRDCFGSAYKEIRLILYENQPNMNTLNIKFYVMLVSQERTSLFVENMELDSDRQGNEYVTNMGEFKELEGTGEDNDTTDNEILNTECSSCSSVQDNTDTWVETASGVIRRFRSGENIGSEKETAFSRKFSNDVELGEHSRREERKLSIQNIAPLRHRRTRPVFQGEGEVLIVRPAIVPREQAFYVYYMSARQKKLQEKLEDSVVHYKRKLQAIVEDAIWHCKRNQLWNDMIEKQTVKREVIESSESWKLLARHGPDVAIVLRAALSISISTTDLDNLLGYVKSESLNMQEPLLDSLTENLNPAIVFKQLIQHFNTQKCRLFCSPNKEHLVIVTADPQQTVFLFTAQNGEPMQVKLLAKERRFSDGESGLLLLEAGTGVWHQFQEIIRCAASFAWMNLVHCSSMS